MTDDCPAPRPHFYCQLFPSVPDTDDAVTESSLRDDDECTRSHLGLRRTIPIPLLSPHLENKNNTAVDRRQRTNGEVVRGRKHSRSVFLATARLSVAVGGWGIWVKCFSLPFFIAAFNSDLAERADDGRTDGHGASRRKNRAETATSHAKP